jgi:hypothetical protein
VSGGPSLERRVELVAQAIYEAARVDVVDARWDQVRGFSRALWLAGARAAITEIRRQDDSAVLGMQVGACPCGGDCGCWGDDA